MEEYGAERNIAPSQQCNVPRVYIQMHRSFSRNSGALATNRVNRTQLRDSQPAASTSCRSPRKKSSIPAHIMENQSAISLYEKIASGADIRTFSSEHLSVVHSYLREFCSLCSAKRDYDSAKKEDDLCKKVAAEIKRRSLEREPNEIPEEEYDMEKSILFAKLTEEIDKFDNETKERKSVLNSRQADDMEKFEAEWREDMPRKYRKASSKLLSLIEKEKRMAIVGNYNEAKQIRVEVEALSQSEAAAAQSQLIADYNFAKKNFVERQKKEERVFDLSRDEARETILKRQKGIIDSFKNREAVVMSKQSQQSPIKFKEVKEGQISPGGISLTEEASKHFDRLLPPLIPPNDERVKQITSRKSKAKTSNQMKALSKKDEQLYEHLNESSKNKKANKQDDESENITKVKKPNHSPEKAKVQKTPEKVKIQKASEKVETTKPEKVETQKTPEKVEPAKPEKVEPAKPEKVEIQKTPEKVEPTKPEKVDIQKTPEKVETTKPEKVEIQKTPEKVEPAKPEKVEIPRIEAKMNQISGTLVDSLKENRAEPKGPGVLFETQKEFSSEGEEGAGSSNGEVSESSSRDYSSYSTSISQPSQS